MWRCEDASVTSSICLHPRRYNQYYRNSLSLDGWIRIENDVGWWYAVAQNMAMHENKWRKGRVVSCYSGFGFESCRCQMNNALIRNNWKRQVLTDQRLNDLTSALGRKSGTSHLLAAPKYLQWICQESNLQPVPRIWRNHTYIHIYVCTRRDLALKWNPS